MRPFVFEAHPARVVFGAGRRAQLGDEVARLGLSRVLLVGHPAQVDEAKRVLGDRVVASVTDVVMHVPIETAEAARKRARETRADGLVALGGGSAVGLAKAVALDQHQPIIAIPSTFAGSEMTSIWGLTALGEKRTGRDERVRPKVVLYDAELAATMPPRLAAASGLNALAHSLEALYAPNVDPFMLVLAEESVRALAAALPRVANHEGLPAVEDALYGAWLAGVALDRTSVGLHHKLCHVLGGTFNLPHAELHAVMLPYSAAYNREAAPEAMARLGRALGTDDPPARLHALGRALGLPGSLAELGLRAGDLPLAVELATKTPYPNPRPVEAAALRQLLEDALAGRVPRSV
jgi:maleylacetate reductase